MPVISQTISHFRLLEKIGVSGMGEVYLADDTTLDRKVSLKHLPVILKEWPGLSGRPSSLHP